jgi:hypothetical protein
LRVVHAETCTSTSDPEHLRQSAGFRHTRQAKDEFGIGARNPTQAPNTIGDLRLIHAIVEIQTENSPPGFTPGSALALPLVPLQCGQRYSLDFALGLIPVINLATWSSAGLTFVRQPLCTRAGLVDQALAFYLPFRDVWAARGTRYRD